MKLLLSSIALLALASCASNSPAMPPESNRLQEGYMPTPFSAERIASACPEGAFRKYAMETPQGEFVQTLSFGAGDSEGTEFTVLIVNMEGVEVANDDMPRTAWTEFQGHASFEEATTTMTLETVETTAGVFDCWVYETDGPMGFKMKSCFAIDLPGPPVLSTGVQSNGESFMRSELIEFGR